MDKAEPKLAESRMKGRTLDLWHGTGAWIQLIMEDLLLSTVRYNTACGSEGVDWA
jgi:hypothetical protein